MAETAAKNQKIKPSRLNSKITRTGFFFIIPFLIVFLTFSIYPFVRTFYLSFTQYKGYGEATFIGLDNYKRVLTSSIFWNSFLNTLKIWGLNIVVQMGLAMLLTIVFADMKYRIKGLGIFRALFYLPNLIAATSVAFLFQTLLDWKYGTINQLLNSFGVNNINWLGEPGTAQFAVSMIGAWMWFGNTFIMLMAGVQGISSDYMEAASIDGAGRMKIFTSITLPLLKPILLYIAITSLIGGLQIFDIPFLITDHAGAPRNSLLTVVMHLYNMAFKNHQVGYSAAVAFVLFFIIAICSAVVYKIMYANKEED